MRKRCILSIILVGCLILMTSCDSILSIGDRVQSSADSNAAADSRLEDFLEAVDNNDVTAAKNEYRNVINGNPELEEMVVEVLTARMENAVSDFNNGNISDTEATVIFDTIASLDILRGTAINPLRNSLNNLISSKSAFAAAELFFESGDYYNAYQQYQLVIPDDTNYADAVSQATLSSEQYVSGVESQVSDYQSENNYIDAVTTVRSAVALIPNNQTLQALQTTVEAGYLQFALDNAAAAYENNRDYEGALVYIREALTILDDESLYDALDYYSSCAPVPLTSLEYVQRAEYIVVGSDENSYIGQNTFTDVNGNTYDANLIIHPTAGDMNGEVAETDDESYVLYNLNFEYTTLSGILYRPYGTLSCDHEWAQSTVVAIYGDDVLLYEAPGFTLDTWDPVSFTVDVSGVRNLRIVMRGIWSEESDWIGLYNRYPKVCMAELYLQR